MLEKQLDHLSSDTVFDLLLTHTALILGLGSVLLSALARAASPL